MTTDESALLAAVRAAPADPLPRLVYADWLEDQGRADQAEYLRAEAELGRLARRLDELAPTLPADWLAEVAQGVLLKGYPPAQKIMVIKLIRELTGCGLAEAKHLSETLPRLLRPAVPAADAARVRQQLRAAGAEFA